MTVLTRTPSQLFEPLASSKPLTPFESPTPFEFLVRWPARRPVRIARALLLFLPLALAAGCAGHVSAATPDPQTTIETMLLAEQAAWNVNDNVAYASVYADDADFINIRGQIFTGRAAIAMVHGQIFAGPFKGSTIKITLRLFKLLATGVAVIDTDQEVTNYAFLPPGITPTSTGSLVTHFKYIAIQQLDGSWKFTAGQNTAVLPN